MNTSPGAISDTPATAAEGRRPHLLWVNQFVHLPSDGGGTRHFEIGRELVRRGWSVTLAGSDFHLHKRHYSRREGADDRRTVREVVDGVEVLWLWAAPYRRNDWRRVHNWWSFSAGVRRLEGSLRPDVVVGSSPQLLAADAAERLARRISVPFLFEVRDLWPESLLAAGGRKGLAYRVLGHVANRLYGAADRIVVLARGTEDYLAKQGIERTRMVHIPNGVDMAAFEGERTGSGEDTFTLVYAGAHGPANGLDRVLDAARILAPDPSIRFRLVGDGPAREALQARAAAEGIRSVEFVDPVSKPELAGILAGADAGLMVLREAPLFAFGVSPNKLFDYMAAGLPVVCNVPGEVARMVADAGAGVQARNSSAEALAEAIRALRTVAPARRVTMGRDARAWVCREHSRGVLASRLEEALESALEGTRA